MTNTLNPAAGGAPVADNAVLAEKAARVIPGGVNSPVRAFGSVGGTPRFLTGGRGAIVTDVEGNEYVDLIGAWGPALLGHAVPEVVDAVQRAAARGFGFGASVPEEAELAEAIIERVLEAERVRLVSTGTEATMTAIRIARGHTGRPLIIKFAGHYHGHSDGLLAAAGSGLATFGLPGSAGVTEATAAQTLVLDYNDLPALEEAFARHEGQIAAVITESAAANMGVLPPEPGFTEGLLRLAHANGALVITDEVLTGFRAGPGGYWGLEREAVQGGAAGAGAGADAGAGAGADAGGLRPDLFTFGKVIGGGLPIAAVAGRAELMNLLAPLGPVYQGGTLSGNPLAVTAGLTTLRAADAAAYERLTFAADTLAGEVSGALAEAGVAHRVQRAGTLMSVLFGDFDDAPRTYDDVLGQNVAQHRAFFHAMLDGGVHLPPSPFETWFVSAAHDEAILSRIAEALPSAARAAARA
ncbi:glutamate-1-semialdehyde 2,1-aminomutase [Leucobacter sp. UCMA 4100]|uniref:glutamate-1-semialdehyde 2,1-aminomutase n=1 Tax=Leucobacter sp. UCMA 4100 TaxID=2810534 RepID=UPI0022EA2CBB|nr:glutamate-1-semialdehyde 2,1-aminomutase [Leucobacter sp. UCMA 4100]MDA3147003.1 glutamate-1-semialdehyde 2,1-aminomutase [Leucobacter sp. UCMA 4100]